MAECYNIVCPYCVDYSCKRTATCDMRLDGEYVKVKHGRWRKERVSSQGYGSYVVYQCSICGAMFHDIGYGYNYCPNCGSRMDLDGDTE